jgi:hypothetical protein
MTTAPLETVADRGGVVRRTAGSCVIKRAIWSYGDHICLLIMRYRGLAPF